MKTLDLIALILPAFVIDHFDAVSHRSDDANIHIFLDEKDIKPNNQEKIISKGFTNATIIQDFPIRGKAVFLHIRRRKWLEVSTNKIITKQYDLTHIGTSLTKDFVAFLKDTHRV